MLVVWRAFGNAASTRRSAGASASWRRSQLMRGFARPSRGASIATPVSVRRASKFLREAQAQVLGELLPALGDVPSLRVVLAQRPVVRGLADRDPPVAHV